MKFQVMADPSLLVPASFISLNDAALPSLINSDWGFLCISTEPDSIGRERDEKDLALSLNEFITPEEETHIYTTKHAKKS